jgi:hypothetical protein
MKTGNFLLLAFIAVLAAGGCTFPEDDDEKDTLFNDAGDALFKMWKGAAGSFTGAAINSAARGAANFAAVSEDGKIAWSAKGTSWTAAHIEAGITTGSLYDIAYAGDNTFIAVGGTSGQPGVILISTDDGKNWTALSTPPDLFAVPPVTSIAYGEPGGVPTLVAGSKGGEIGYAAKDPGPGWTWTKAGWAGTSNIFVSIDGDNVSASVESIIFGNGKFIAAGQKGRMAASANGRDNWTRISSSFDDLLDTISGMAYDGDGKFIAVESGQGSGRMASSTDGAVWVQIDNGPFGTDYNDGAWDIAYAEGVFVAAGYGGKAAYTKDGGGWTAVTDSKFGTKTIKDIAYGDGVWIAVGDNGTIAVGTK